MLHQDGKGVVTFSITKLKDGFLLKKKEMLKSTYFETKLTIKNDQTMTRTFNDPYEMVWSAKDTPFTFEKLMHYLGTLVENES